MNMSVVDVHSHVDLSQLRGCSNAASLPPPTQPVTPPTAHPNRPSQPQVAGALGLDLAMPAASNMMRYAAECVLGWASGPGRNRAQIMPAEFAALVDHFRVTD